VRVITLARKPLIGSVAENVLRHGTGGLNIDGCRVTSVVLESERRTSIRGKSEFWGLDAKQEGARHNPAGRWPPNVILEHRPECRCVGTKKVITGGSGIPAQTVDSADYLGNSMGKESRTGKDPHPCHRDSDGLEEVPAWDCHPDCPVKALDEQSGELHSQDPISRARPIGVTGFNTGENTYYSDVGGASRFFKQVKQDEP